MLSICIPTLNRAALLKKSLDVLLTFKDIDIEINISNNGSADNTLEVINEYKNKFLNFNFVSFENTVDIISNFDSAIRLATQKYIFLIPDDDICIESGLVDAVKMMEAEIKLIAVYGGYKEYTLDEKFLVDTKKCDSIEIYNNANRYDLMKNHWSFELPVFRREFYQEHCLIHANSTVISWVFLDSVLKRGEIAATPLFFFKHYIHKDRVTERNAADSHTNFMFISEVEIFLANTPIDQNKKMEMYIHQVTRIYNFHAAVCLRNNDFIQARFFISKGFFFNPNHFQQLISQWDKNYLMPASIQEIKNRIAIKDYIKRVFVICKNEKEKQTLVPLFKDLCVDDVIPVSNFEQILSYNNIEDFIITFEREDSLKDIPQHNLAVFTQITNALKFTDQKINIVM